MFLNLKDFLLQVTKVKSRKQRKKENTYKKQKGKL